MLTSPFDLRPHRYDVKIIATSNTVYVGTSADEGAGAGKALHFVEGSPDFVVQVQ